MKLVIEDRSKYLSAIFTIIRAYILSKEKVKSLPLVGFEGWCKFVQQPLVWLGCDDPVKCVEGARREDTSKDNAKRLIEQWLIVSQWIKDWNEYAKEEKQKRPNDPNTPKIYNRLMKTGDLIKFAMYASSRGDAMDDPTWSDDIAKKYGWQSNAKEQFADLFELLMEYVPNRAGIAPENKRLGKWLSLMKDQTYTINRGEYAGQSFRFVMDWESSGHGNNWRLDSSS
jgi:hypothetical protein